MKSQGNCTEASNQMVWLLSVRSMTALMCALLIIIATTAAVAVTIHFSVIGTKEVATHRAKGIANKAKNDLETFLNAAVNTAIGWQYSFARGIRPLPTDMESQNPQYCHIC